MSDDTEIRRSVDVVIVVVLVGLGAVVLGLCSALIVTLVARYFVTSDLVNGAGIAIVDLLLGVVIGLWAAQLRRPRPRP